MDSADLHGKKIFVIHGHLASPSFDGHLVVIQLSELEGWGLVLVCCPVLKQGVK